jgi:hypothetical protein
MGTIQMKPQEQGGCVDAHLNVYGTVNLKAAGPCRLYVNYCQCLTMFIFPDLSTHPGSVGGPTYSNVDHGRPWTAISLKNVLTCKRMGYVQKQ